MSGCSFFSYFDTHTQVPVRIHQAQTALHLSFIHYLWFRQKQAAGIAHFITLNRHMCLLEGL